jgi:hypothetical protein
MIYQDEKQTTGASLLSRFRKERKSLPSRYHKNIYETFSDIRPNDMGLHDNDGTNEGAL